MRNKQWAIDALITELFKADRILKNGLAVMTPEQKVQWADRNAKQDLLDDGGTIRSNERERLFNYLKNDGAVFCRKCGCTENVACGDGCYWVEPDLCSACVTPQGDASWK